MSGFRIVADRMYYNLRGCSTIGLSLSTCPGDCKLYDSSGTFNCVVELDGVGKGAVFIVPSDDIAAGKSWSVLTSPNIGTAPSCVTDHNDDTYCQWYVDVGSLVNFLQLDLGTPMYGYLRFVAMLTPAATSYFSVRVSNDGSTWTEIYQWNPSTRSETINYINGYRYIRFAGVNVSSTSMASMFIYSAEFYQARDLSFSRTLSNVSGRLVIYVHNAQYMLTMRPL